MRCTSSALCAVMDDADGHVGADPLHVKLFLLQEANNAKTHQSFFFIVASLSTFL